MLHTRSFHPRENFGGGGLFYEGDNRGFQTSLAVTSRIRNRVLIDLKLAKLKSLDTRSDPSRNAVTGWSQDYSSQELQPTSKVSGQVDPYRADGDQHAQVLLSYRGQNFAMPFIENDTMKDFYKGIVPDLDVTNSVDIHVNRDEKGLTFACRMVGDGFPNAESFLIDPSKNDLFLVTHRRIGSATGQLAANRKIAMASSSARVDFPDDLFGSGLHAYWAQDYATHVGGPIDLFEEAGGKPSTRTGWNRMHQCRDAQGGRVRRWWLDNDVVWVKGRKGSSMP